MFSRLSVSMKYSKQFLKMMERTYPSSLRNAPVISLFHPFAISSMYSTSTGLKKNDGNSSSDLILETENHHIIQLSHYVMNNNLEESLREYSKLPLLLPRSDFRVVCSLMQQLGEQCGIPDLENIFTKIQKMKLSRKHALTFRCLIRLACELKDPELIQTFYNSICEEEVYVNNSFLNDITIDCLFSIEAYPTICSLFDSMQSLIDKGKILPTFNNHSSQNATTAFITEGRDDLLIFFLQRIKSNWRIPVSITDYIVSNSIRNKELSLLFDLCIQSQPKSATLINSIIDFYVQDNNPEMAISTIKQAISQEVKVTSMSYKNICELLIVLKDQQSISQQSVIDLSNVICSLSRGGYVVQLGLSPLEMMLAYNQVKPALKYLGLLKEYDNALQKRDVKVLEEMKTKYVNNKSISSGLDDLVQLIQKKFK